jgi:hypothetical protein
LTDFNRRGWLGLKLWLVLGLLAVPVLGGSTPAEAYGGTTFFVSKLGSNADGRSWATAWNELDQINWGQVRPGDTVAIDGGAVRCPSLGPGYGCGMVYNSTLSVQASGAPGAPIYITGAFVNGRNGGVIIDGGVTSWPGCGPGEAAPPAVPNGRGTRAVGIDLNSSQNIVIDGLRWGGIEVRNHTRYGINFGGSAGVSARYLKLHHITDPTNASNGAAGATFGYQSHHNTLSRSELFRNGQDGIRVAGDYVTISESFLHDHYCNHPDGIQAFVPTANADVPDDAGEITGLNVTRNVFQHIGLQALLLGENGSHQSWATHVNISDNLFLYTPYMVKSKHGNSHNWNIQNNTFVAAGGEAIQWCCAQPGAVAPMTVQNNVFVGAGEGATAFDLTTGGGNTTFANNCVDSIGHIGGNINEAGTVWASPWFANGAAGNFALRGGSPCAGKGARLSSIAQLLASTGP